MTGTYDSVEVIISVQCRRRWTSEEKIQIVGEAYLPGNSVSLVARRHGIAGNQLFIWRRLMAQGALTTAIAGEEVVPASDYRALEHEFVNCSVYWARRRWRTNCCARQSPGPQTQKNGCALDFLAAGWSVNAVAGVVGLSRPHLSAIQRAGERRRQGRPPLPDTETVADIRRLIAELPTYG